MLPQEAAALAAFQAVYGATVTYTGAGLTSEEVGAIKSDTRAARFEGFEGQPREISFEIPQASLPDEPDKEDLIVEATGERWSVIDVAKRDDVAAWVVVVEEAAP